MIQGLRVAVGVGRGRNHVIVRIAGACQILESERIIRTVMVLLLACSSTYSGFVTRAMLTSICYAYAFGG